MGVFLLFTSDLFERMKLKSEVELADKGRETGNSMAEFLLSNPGLKSRFNKSMDFPNYTLDELIEIFEHFCSKNDYNLTEEAVRTIKKYRIRFLDKR